MDDEPPVIIRIQAGDEYEGRPRSGWIDGVKVALDSRGETVNAARQYVNDRNDWRALMLVNMYMIEFHLSVFAWFLCSFGATSHVRVPYYVERGGMPLHDSWGELQ